MARERPPPQQKLSVVMSRGTVFVALAPGSGTISDGVPGGGGARGVAHLAGVRSKGVAVCYGLVYSDPGYRRRRPASENAFEPHGHGDGHVVVAGRRHNLHAQGQALAIQSERDLRNRKL